MKLGEILIQNGLINETQLNQALEAQKSNPDKKLGELLVEMGFVSAVTLAETLTRQ